MQTLLHFAHLVAIFLVFLSATKLIQTAFLMVTAAKKREVFEPTQRNQIVIWFAISYLLTAFVSLVS